MKTQRTVYHLIVDRSGSMSDCISATLEGFNEQIARIRSMEAEFPEQEILAGLSLFNEGLNHLHMAIPCRNIPVLDRQNYYPQGGTSLLDAIGQTAKMLSEIENRLSCLPTTYVVIVLTDGYENSSRFFTLEQVRTLIREFESTGKWTFSLIGATPDAVDVATDLSIKVENSFSFEKAQMKGEVWDKLSGSMHVYLRKKQSGGDISKLYDN